MRKNTVLLIALICVMVSTCSPLESKCEKTQITVSIAPIGWIVESLTDSSTEVNVLVSPGVSPETYEPTARQIEDLRRSKIFFSIGLIDFEKQIEDRIKQAAAETKFIRLADSLPLIEAQCGHVSHSNVGYDHHGTDPHVWLSPKMLMTMTRNVAKILISNNIGSNESILSRRDSMLTLLDSLDKRIEKMIALTNGSKKIAVVHPSLGYFARDYGLTQLSIETDGKEPSGQRIKALIDTLLNNNIRMILHSRQDPKTAAEVIARHIDGRTEEFDPMARDLPESLIKLAILICNIN